MSARLISLLVLPLLWGAAQAHDPIFAVGPHVIYRGGVQTAFGWRGDEGGGKLAADLTYGLTGDLALNLELPADGAGPVEAAGKYRFWRRDALRLQESTALAVRLIDDRGANRRDAVVGLTYGYESRTWYRWAALRYRRNAGARDDVLLMDLVLGRRTWPGGYRDPDWVWMVEWNGVRRLGGTTDGYLSPGLFWTLRNFAVKLGVQLPVAGNVDGPRGRMTLEWHW